jgi:hypothetical protein
VLIYLILLFGGTGFYRFYFKFAWFAKFYSESVPKFLFSNFFIDQDWSRKKFTFDLLINIFSKFQRNCYFPGEFSLTILMAVLAFSTWNKNEMKRLRLMILPSRNEWIFFELTNKISCVWQLFGSLIFFYLYVLDS